METKRDQILRMAAALGIVRPQDLQSAGIAPAYLQRLSEKGELLRVGRGVYMLPGAEISEHHSLAEAAKRCPQGVICLLSALRFHELGTETPGQVWLALPQDAAAPRAADLSIRVVRFSPLGMERGIERHTIEGVEVQMTSKARTLVDCFRFRNKIGLETALEALRSGLQQGLAPTEIRQFAEVFRQAKVLRPYLEALL